MWFPNKYIINFFKFGVGCYISPLLVSLYDIIPQWIIFYGIFSLIVSSNDSKDTEMFNELEKLKIKQDEMFQKLDQIHRLVEVHDKPITYDYSESDEDEDECEHNWVKECRGYDDYWKVCTKCKKDITN